MDLKVLRIPRAGAEKSASIFQGKETTTVKIKTSVKAGASVGDIHIGNSGWCPFSAPAWHSQNIVKPARLRETNNKIKIL
jgi:hypothetical protein